MHRPALLLLLLAACSTSPSPGTGTIVYAEAATGHVRVLDVATGDDRLIDGAGAFGSVAISRDGRYIAYVGADAIVRVAPRDGAPTQLPLPNGTTAFTTCAGGPTWGPNNSLAYCIYDQGFASYGFVPTPGAPVRKLLATEVAIADDGARIVYHRRTADPTARGDVVVENADGSDARVLRADVIERGFAFTPDGLRVVATADDPAGTRVVIHTLADGTTTDLGAGNVPRAIRGGSIFSPDGSEVLAVLGGELVAVALTTGARRPFVNVTSEMRIGQAAFIDAGRVIYGRLDSRMLPGSSVVETSQSVHAASAAGPTIVMPEADVCYVRAIALGAAVAAIECDEATLVSFDGTVHAATTARFALGIGDDGHGAVTLADDGSLAFVTTDEDVRPLATAMSRSELPDAIFGPVAAYAP